MDTYLRSKSNTTKIVIIIIELGTRQRSIIVGKSTVFFYNNSQI